VAEQRVQRRLAAILAADVVGYSRLMREDETGTLAQLKTLRKEVFDPRIADTPENERIMVLGAKPKPMTMEASYVRTE
jgi:hypothetical protein